MSDFCLTPTWANEHVIFQWHDENECFVPHLHAWMVIYSASSLSMSEQAVRG